MSKATIDDHAHWLDLCAGNEPSAQDAERLHNIAVLLRALSAGQAQPVAIKPLEWNRYAGGGTDFAETILGSWSVWDFDGENAHVRGPSDHAGRLVGGNLDTAKAAAQADYEARIRSALVSRAVPGEVETKSREGCVGEMTPDRAIYFLDRFKREEKMLGPHEQWALDFAIAALSVPFPEIEGGDKGDVPSSEGAQHGR